MIVHVEAVVSGEQGMKKSLENLVGVMGGCEGWKRSCCISTWLIDQPETKGWTHWFTIMDIEEGDGEVAEQAPIYNAAGAPIRTLLTNWDEEKGDAGTHTNGAGDIQFVG